MGAQDLQRAINGGLLQNDRLIKLDTPLGDNVLLPQRVTGHARIGRDYGFTLDVVSTTGDLELKRLIAQPVTLWLQQTNRAYRPYHGYVHAARRLGADGGLTAYQIEFASWLHFLRFRKDARIWQDQSADAILADVFNAHHQAQGAFRFEIHRALPQRSFCLQYEDDWNFCQRIMEAEGLFSYFEQADDGQSHTVVITDNVDSLPALNPQSVNFYRSGVDAETDALVQWSGTRTLQSVQLTTRTFDYKAPAQAGNPKGTSIPTWGSRGNLPAQAEVYEYTGAYTYGEQSRGDTLSRIRMEEWESRSKRFDGAGAVRGLDAGRWFELTGHPEYERASAQDREFVVIGATWHIENNLPVTATPTRAFPSSLQGRLAAAKAAWQGAGTGAGIGKALEVAHADGSEGFLLVQIEAQRRSVPYRSPFEHARPDMSMQTAIVAGPVDEEVYTDSLNRIKVRFHWDRLNPGDEKASCWVRVAMSDTGAGYGGVHVPRVGEEVIVNWLDGDCDRPIVTGRVYNGATNPAWHSNGVLSGYRSKEYGGSGYNQMVMDDATGQNRLQLYSTSANSQLHLGYLIAQDGNARGAWLGSGFELKSDAYGAVRAQRGLYVNTCAKDVASAQLDATEAQEQLARAHETIGALSQASGAHQAESLEDGAAALQRFASATQSGAQGAQAGGGNTAGGGAGSANAFSEPVMLMASPAGIALSTPRSAQVAADRQITLVGGQNVQIASGQSLIAGVAQKISLFAQNAGMKLFAGKGAVKLQAHDDAIEVTAQQALKLLSTGADIEVAAYDEILLTSGGAYIRLKGGNIELHAPGKIDIKGSQHQFSGPARANYALPGLPTSTSAVAMQYLYHDDEPVQGAKYVATLADGSTRQGTLDSMGRMNLPDTPAGTVQVALGPDARPYARKDRTGNPDFRGGALSDADIDSLLQKHGGA